jgi:NADH-quinone oxidoreductase subunit L
LRAGNDAQQFTAWIVLIAAVVTAFLTALYMTRACVKTFWGEYRGHGTPHESAGSMVTPLWILAILSLTVGFLGFPVIGVFQTWITIPGEEHHGFSTLYNIILPVGSVAVALIAVYIGVQLFHRNRWRYDLKAGPFGWMYTFVENKYYLDFLYLRGIVRPVQYPIARAMYWTNNHIFDAIVNGAGTATVKTSQFVYEDVDQNVVDFAVNGAAGITGLTGGLLRYIQTGNVQRYAAILFAAIAIFVALFAIL